MSLPSGERLLRTIFWALWMITAGTTVYAIGAELFGLSIFYPNFPYKYHVFTIEYPVLAGITSCATLMLAIATALVWRLSPRLGKFGITACALGVFYNALPRF